METAENGLARVSSWCVLACISSLFVLVPVAWWPKDLYGLIKWVVVGIAACGAAAAWIASSLLRGEFNFRRNLINIPLILTVLISAISFWSGPARYYVVRRFSEVICLALIYGVLISVLDERHKKFFLIISAFAGLSVISLLGIAHYFGFFPVDSPWGTGLGRRVYATMLNPIFLADYIIGLLPLAFSLFVFHSRRARNNIMLLLVMMISFICLLFTVAWGAFLGWLVSLAVCGSLAVRRGRGLRAGVMAVLLLIIFGSFIYLNRDTVAADVSGMKYRILYWRASVAMIRERPLSGFGLNSFQPYVPKYLTEIIAADFPDGVPADETAVTVYEGVFAHNEYLALLIERGIIGLALFLWLMIAFFGQALRNIRLREDSFDEAIGIGAIGGAAAILVQSFFNYPLRVPASTVSFAALLALVGSGAACRRLSLNLRGIPFFARIAAALLLVSAYAFAVPYFWRPLIGERLYVEARYASPAGNWPFVRDRCRASLGYPLAEPEFYDLLGEAEEKTGSPSGAIAAFNDKLILKPYDVHAHTRLGVLYEKEGMYDEAISHLSRAVGLERHDSAEGRALLAGLLCRVGRLDEAMKLLRDGLRAHGSDWRLRNALGIAYARTGEPEKARAEFEAAQRLKNK